MCAKFFKNKIYKLLLVVILLFLLIFLYFFNSGSDEINIVIANERYTFSKNDTKFEIDLITLNSQFDTIIKKESLFSNVKINGKKLYFKRNMGVLDINEKKTIDLEIKFKGDTEYTKYVINTFPKKMPKFSFTGKSKTSGDFYFTTYGASFGEINNGAGVFLLKMDNSGKISFYRQGGYKSYLFKKQIIDNKIYYTYLDESKSNGIVNLYVLDEKYKLIKTIKNICKTDNGSINFHDYLLIDLDNYIFADTNNDGSEVICEIKNGRVIWERKWNVSEFLDIDENGDKVLINKEYHFNSFELDSDSNLLVSFRHSDEIVKIDRNTGEIIWTLGGKYNDFDKNIFSRQHSIVRVENMYMVFNNNNKSTIDPLINKDIKSSIVTFSLDQENMKVVDFHNYNLDYFSYELGSVWPTDIENNVYVVDYGRSIDKEKKCFEEINLETGEVYFSFEYPDTTSFVYRTYKY